jgi:predicted phage terminase large subunit-like protein
MNTHKFPRGYPLKICIGVDLAVKEGESNDYTAIVVGKLLCPDGIKKLYIDRIINRRMNFPTAIQELRLLNQEYKDQGYEVEIFIEDAGLQIAWVQQLAEYGITAKPVKVGGAKKETRIHTTSHWVKEGRIFFLKTEMVPLIEQLIGFGIEKHDDLADAFTLLAIEVLSAPIISVPEIFTLGYGRDDD